MFACQKLDPAREKKLMKREVISPPQPKAKRRAFLFRPTKEGRDA